VVMTDPIADMLTRIRNAGMARHDTVDVPASNIKEAIARILEREGYIRTYRKLEDHKQGMLRLYLRYMPNRKPVFGGLVRVSKPGSRKYVGKKKIPAVYAGRGTVIVSTSQGILTGEECKNRGIGGEVLCYLW